MQILNIEPGRLGDYVQQQISVFFPVGETSDAKIIAKHLPLAMSRLDHCISRVAIWKPGQFDILHSVQYCTFLYYLANSIWKCEGANATSTRLFLLNKALNAIDLFYEVELPEFFLIGHTVGVVLGKATYGNGFVVFQNSTVGQNNGRSPILEDGVILFPNTVVAGGCTVKRGAVVSQGVRIIDQNTEEGMLVFGGNGRELTFRKCPRNYLDDYFRS